MFLSLLSYCLSYKKTILKQMLEFCWKKIDLLADEEKLKQIASLLYGYLKRRCFISSQIETSSLTGK